MQFPCFFNHIDESNSEIMQRKQKTCKYEWSKEKVSMNGFFVLNYSLSNF